MTPSFSIDQDGITITLTLDSQYEKSVAKMLKEFEVLHTSVNEKHSHHPEPEVLSVSFRMTRRDTREPDIPVKEYP